MKTSTPPFLRRFLSCAATVILVAVLTACTGTGGGKLPPTAGFTGPASFGFDFSCERSSRSTSPNPPTGQLRIELSYTDHGTYLPLGSPFSIHGIVDTIDPVLESGVCIGQNPPPEPLPPNELIFLGRYRPTTSAPAGLEACPRRETSTTPLCRFEVFVRDNDQNRAPSTGDFFSIKLSSATVLSSQLDPATVVYARAGLLEGGNLIVK
ncbi:MAG: hypothetical protein M3303_05355 [Gemmatimonadota bacterium]|nr:hypothetical protein [Gemmatimonadota bacterium]